MNSPLQQITHQHDESIRLIKKQRRLAIHEINVAVDKKIHHVKERARQALNLIGHNKPTRLTPPNLH